MNSKQIDELKQFISEWRENRLLREIEIEMMKSDNLDKELDSKNKQLIKHIEGRRKKDTTAKDLRAGTYRRGDDERKQGYNQALQDILDYIKGEQL